MPNIKITQLSRNQLVRLEMVFHIMRDVKSAKLCEVEGNSVARRIEDDECNFYYPDDNDLDFILNGIKLERNKK